MFNFNYPGSCFGLYAEDCKECKKCKIKQFCMKEKIKTDNGSGMSFFYELIKNKFNCSEVEDDNDLTVSCFDKTTQALILTAVFCGNGSLHLTTDQHDIDVPYLISEEKSKILFDSLWIKSTE